MDDLCLFKQNVNFAFKYSLLKMKVFFIALEYLFNFT